MGVQRPPCFGDGDYYDEEDDTCRDCAVEGACLLKVKRAGRSKLSDIKKQTRERRNFRTTPIKSTSIQAQRKEEVVEVEPAEDDSYFSVLTHNASIEALQSVCDELANSVRQIPRKSYSGVFKRKKQ